jgi:hypothetical protein
LTTVKTYVYATFSSTTHSATCLLFSTTHTHFRLTPCVPHVYVFSTTRLPGKCDLCVPNIYAYQLLVPATSSRCRRRHSDRWWREPHIAPDDLWECIWETCTYMRYIVYIGSATDWSISSIASPTVGRRTRVDSGACHACTGGGHGFLMRIPGLHCAHHQQRPPVP